MERLIGALVVENTGLRQQIAALLADVERLTGMLVEQADKEASAHGG